MLARRTVLAFALTLVLGACGASQTAQQGRPPDSPQASGIICGVIDDKLIRIPPKWTTFIPPPVGQTYVDPVFGCPVKRLTDSGVEESLWDGTHPSFMNYYSTLTAMNANDTMLLIYSDNGGWRIKDLHGKVVVPNGKMPAMNNGHPVWDAREGEVFYYALGKSMYKGIIHAESIKRMALQTFKEYSGIVLPDAADLSEDGDHIALMGQNTDNTLDAFVWSLGKRTKTSVYATKCKIEGSITETVQPGCVHKLLLSADNLLSIGFAENGTAAEQGVRLWNGSSLIHLQDGMTDHYDHGYDMNGRPVFAELGNSSTLLGMSNPCPSGWGLDVRQQDDLSSAACLLDNVPPWHVSYRGGPSQPWAALSFFDERKPGPEFISKKDPQEPSKSNWKLYEDEIILARIDGRVIYRLAHARSRSASGYWAQPHATISRDGKYVVFTSNMAHPNGCKENMHVPDECTDVYVIRVQ